MNAFKSIPGSSFRSLTLVLVLGLLGATPALADTEGVRSMKVSYADLDLNTQAGAATLYGRIRGAARQLCGYEGSTFTDKAIWSECFKRAVGDAVAKVNSPQLTALYQGKSPAVIAMRAH
jgi:UrcA family protein